jgi:hypothetical protein
MQGCKGVMLLHGLTEKSFGWKFSNDGPPFRVNKRIAKTDARCLDSIAPFLPWRDIVMFIPQK